MVKVFSKCSVVLFGLMLFFGNIDSCYGMDEKEIINIEEIKIENEKEQEEEVVKKMEYFVNRNCLPKCDNLDDVDEKYKKKNFKKGEIEEYIKFNTNRNKFAAIGSTDEYIEYVKKEKSFEVDFDFNGSKYEFIINEGNKKKYLEILENKRADLVKGIKSEENDEDCKQYEKENKERLVQEYKSICKEKNDIEYGEFVFLKYGKEKYCNGNKFIVIESKISNYRLIKRNPIYQCPFKVFSFLEGMYLNFNNFDSKLRPLSIFASIAFKSALFCIGGHNVYKTISGNLHVYTSNFPSFAKFTRLGISYKINKIIYCNIIGFNLYKCIYGILSNIYFYSEVNRVRQLSINKTNLPNPEEKKKILRNIKLLRYSFYVLNSLEVSVDFSLSKYYCISFDISSLVMFIIYNIITRDKNVRMWASDLYNINKYGII